MIKVSLLTNNSKTIPSGFRYKIKNHRDDLNYIRFPFLANKLSRISNLERDFDDVIDNNTNNYRKIMFTYFEEYD